jgi:hypothetical protein
MIPEPKTVTFNALPQDEAQYRSARLGSQVIGITLGSAAISLTAVALLWSLNFAVSLAVSWGEVLKLSLIAVGSTMALAGLPVASALLQRSYPIEARWAMLLWGWAMAIAAISMMVFAITLTSEADGTAAISHQPAITQSDVFRLENRVQDDVWYYSNGCRNPQDGYQSRHCRDVIEARQAMASGGSSGDWSPRSVLPLTANAGNGVGRSLLVVLLGLLAIAGAGLLGRLAVLATAETYRLGTGEASAISPPPAQIEQAPMLEGAGALTPADAFSMWACGRLMSVQGREVTGSAAYDDYSETCRLNGIEPMAAGKFGTLLTARAAATDGRVIKTKTNGVMVYRGWELPDLITIGP